MWTPDDSLNKLYRSCDPRDQLAEDVRRVQNPGISSVFQNNNIKIGLSMEEILLKKRQSQLDPRDQEYHDISTYLNKMK